MAEKKEKKITNDKITLVGLLCSFIFGLLFGGVVYLIVKTFNLKNPIWYILFAFLPPIIGAIVYWRSKAKKV